MKLSNVPHRPSRYMHCDESRLTPGDSDMNTRDARTTDESMSHFVVDAFKDSKTYRLFLVGAARYISPQRKIEGIVKHILINYGAVLHVRRTVGWLGFVALGIEKVVGANWYPSLSRRSVYFRSRGKTYRVKFDHEIENGGGIVIVKLKGRFARYPEKSPVVSIRTLQEAEHFYLYANSYFE